MGPGGLATPEAGGRLRAPPQQTDRCWRSGRTVGYGFSVVFGWRALRPPRVVFASKVGFVSLINSLDHFRQKKNKVKD